jgi:hypothetical protein
MKASVLIVLSLALFIVSLPAQQVPTNEAKYMSDGQLARPDNYREWIYLSSGLGMTYGIVQSAANTVLGDRFDNVFVNPQAYKSFLGTGAWPDKTMFAMEVRSSASKSSINKGGRYQEELVGLEVHLKDQSRFPNKWAFFVFSPADKTAKPLPANSNCQTCHSRNGAVDETFVQFYPTLMPIAKAKGTFKGDK